MRGNNAGPDITEAEVTTEEQHRNSDFTESTVRDK